MAVITVPKALREKLGEEGADSIVELINLANQQVKEDVIELSSERFERRLTEESAKLDKRITEEMAKLRGEDLPKLDKRITEEMAKLRSEDIANLDKKITDNIAKLDNKITDNIAKLDNKISETKAEIIRWMFIFWVGQFAAIVGTLTAILFAFFKR